MYTSKKWYIYHFCYVRVGSQRASLNGLLCFIPALLPCGIQIPELCCVLPNKSSAIIRWRSRVWGHPNLCRKSWVGGAVEFGATLICVTELPNASCLASRGFALFKWCCDFSGARGRRRRVDSLEISILIYYPTVPLIYAVNHFKMPGGRQLTVDRELQMECC